MPTGTYTLTGRLALESGDLRLEDIQFTAAALHAMPARPESALQVLQDIAVDVQRRRRRHLALG
jgi:hypothetical protein